MYQGERAMKKIPVISFLVALLSFLFSNVLFAATPLTVTLTVDNAIGAQLAFTSSTPDGNTCTSQGPNQITCSITQLNSIPFIADLTWTSQKNSHCMIDVGLTQDLNSGGYMFKTLASDYGFIIAPGTHWDGKSNLNAHMSISAVRTDGC